MSLFLLNNENDYIYSLLEIPYEMLLAKLNIIVLRNFIEVDFCVLYTYCLHEDTILQTTSKCQWKTKQTQVHKLPRFANSNFTEIAECLSRK